MTTLITGATGKTGSSLARLFHKANYPFLVATRSGKAEEPYKAVQFDWFDSSSFENPFKADSNIDRVYIVAPTGSFTPLTVVAPFIDLAISKGVKRFVLLTSTNSDPGVGPFGAIHAYLIEKGVDYAVLRPSWFMQNFGTGFVQTIKEYNMIFSAAGDGKIPWISSEDIAQAAFNALTAEKSPNTDYFILGPELYTYDEVAEILSSIIGREIKHKKNTVEEAQAFYQKFGLGEEYAKTLAMLENLIAEGKEALYVDEPEERKYVGKHTIRQYFTENRDLWMK